LSAEFHRFGCLWTDTSISFYLDDVCTAIKPITGRREYWQPFYLIINLAIGSRKRNWVPAPDASMPNSVDLLVRSVRAWQRTGPREIVPSSAAASESALPGTQIARLSCKGAYDPQTTMFRLLNDAGGAFAIVRNVLVTAESLRFMAQPSEAIIVEAVDERQQTWQQPVSILVLDEGIAPNAFAAGSEQHLAHPAWMKFGVRVCDAEVGGPAELLLERPITADHAVEQLISKAAVPLRYVVSADLKSHGRDWVKFEISANYGKNVQVYFNLAHARVGTRFASADASPFRLNECWAIKLDTGFVRCLVDLTTDASPSLRVSLKLVTADPDDNKHPGDPLRGIMSRSFLRAVAISAAQ
jgi:hypothetical protein